MARSVNRVQLLGNLGHSPDVKYTAEGTAVANFTMATTDTWKDKSGEKHESTEWHRIVVWRGLAEIAGKYLHKGSKVFVDGKLQTREWEKDGVKRHTTEIVASELVLLDGRQDDGDPGPAAQEPRAPSSRPAQGEQGAEEPYHPSADGENDLPFS